MLKIMLAAVDRENLSPFAQGLAANTDVELTWVDSGASALRRAAEEPPHLVVVGEELGDMSGLDLVNSLLRLNAFINTAVISALSAEDFHEAGEGLGIMVQLSPRPGPAHANEVLTRLSKITSFSAA
ncbi:MAG: response regulator [Pseudomonadota bacterium]